MRKSSSLARIRDLVNNISGELDNAQAEHEDLMSYSARLKEIEPALAKLQAALNPATIEPATGKMPSDKEWDLCKSCKHGEDSDFDCTHYAAESCGGYDKITEPIKRIRRIRKKLLKVPPAELTIKKE
jgi:hypothetical protein